MCAARTSGVTENQPSRSIRTLSPKREKSISRCTQYFSIAASTPRVPRRRRRRRRVGGRSGAVSSASNWRASARFASASAASCAAAAAAAARDACHAPSSSSHSTSLARPSRAGGCPSASRGHARVWMSARRRRRAIVPLQCVLSCMCSCAAEPPAASRQNESARRRLGGRRWRSATRSIASRTKIPAARRPEFRGGASVASMPPSSLAGAGGGRRRPRGGPRWRRVSAWPISLCGGVEIRRDATDCDGRGRVALRDARRCASAAASIVYTAFRQMADRHAVFNFTSQSLEHATSIAADASAREDCITLVATAGDEILGFVASTPIGGGLYDLGPIAVTIEKQAGGIGRALVQGAVALPAPAQRRDGRHVQRPSACARTAAAASTCTARSPSASERG